MQEIMLTVKETAELKGCSERYIKRLIAEGKLECVETANSKNRKKYLIPLSSLPDNLQRRYYQQRKRDEVKSILPVTPSKPLDCYTDAEKREITFWMNLVEKWQAYRKERSSESKAETDHKFVLWAQLEYDLPHLSVTTLYRRWEAIRKDNLDGLVDMRGKSRRGKSCIDDKVWDVFLSYYLDLKQPTVDSCYRSTWDWLQIKQPESLPLPHPTTFRRRIQREVPPAVLVYEREGEEAMHDRCAPYMTRLYDHMEPNDYWIADNHTFDFMTLGSNGRPHRLYLTAFLDARSTAFVGWCVTYAPCGDATLIALRDAILRTNSVPKNIYVDNGTEFLVHDIGGNGHRTKKKPKKEEDFHPPDILTRLGINMVNAIPGNPEAKIIERIFLDVKNMLSKLVSSYCGGTIAERPENLNRMLKQRDIPTDDEMIRVVNEFVEGYYNHLPYNGAVAADRGKPKMQVYTEHLYHVKRPKSKEDLRLMLMRSSRPVKVGRKGVSLDIAGYKLFYWTDEFLLHHQKEKVYYRYDPQDLTVVHVYDENNKYIDTLPVDNDIVMEYGASSDEIKSGMRRINSYNKMVKQWRQGHALSPDEKITALDLMRIRAQQNIQNPPDYTVASPKVIEIVAAEVPERKELPTAVNQAAPLDTMIANLKKYKGDQNDG